MMKICIFTVSLLICSSYGFHFGAKFLANRVGKSSIMHLSSDPESFELEKDYLQALKDRSKLPEGFQVGATRFKFEPVEMKKTLPMNVTVILAEQPSTSYAAVFTSNKFPGGPIYVGRDRMKKGMPLQAIIVNNKISNVCPGGSPDFGRTDSEAVCSALAQTFGLESPDNVLPSSTGVIGWRLPLKAMADSMSTLKTTLQSESIYPAAIGITTTDRYAKVRRFDSSSSNWSLVGIAKGAGMIEPNMATMLSYLLTDLDVPREKLQEMLKKSVAKSYNCISVDGDQSTSDTVCLLSSQKKKINSESDLAEFQRGLDQVCQQLSVDIVHNGEGTQHVIRLKVTGAPTEKIGRELGKAVINSNLVKTAISGNDPNVGRIAMAVGSYLGNIEKGGEMAEGLEIFLGGVCIFSNSAFQLNAEKEVQLSDYMLNAQLYPDTMDEHDRTFPFHRRFVDIEVKLKTGPQDNSVTVYGSDLTKEYVAVNADYRS